MVNKVLCKNKKEAKKVVIDVIIRVFENIYRYLDNKGEKKSLLRLVTVIERSIRVLD